MKGDFTRDTFDPLKQFSRVLLQQGRVLLDADYNEQTAILLRYVHKLARDTIGPFAAPTGPAGGFHLDVESDGIFRISQGCYYVDGVLVENNSDKCTYKSQPDYPVPPDDLLLVATATSTGAESQTFGIYLDVWERHITPVEDDSIREKALGGPGTCTRAKVVWQVKAAPLSGQIIEELKAAERAYVELIAQKKMLESNFQNVTDVVNQSKLIPQIVTLEEQLILLDRLSLLPIHEAFLSQLVSIGNAKLAARVDRGQTSEEACVTPPASKYRGAENQLYRVEIHQDGKAGEATFKWSRDNGSIATAWLGLSGNDLQVAGACGFTAGNCIELCDDNKELLGKPGVLLKLAKVEGDVLTVDAASTVPAIIDFPKNPKVRRWDGAMQVQESAAGNDVWIDLEDGVQIRFTTGGEYRTGDYWLIPARVATGNIEWPQDHKLNPQPLPPHGVEHHYALIGWVERTGGKTNVLDLRCEFRPCSTASLARKSDSPNKDLPVRRAASHG